MYDVHCCDVKARVLLEGSQREWDRLAPRVQLTLEGQVVAPPCFGGAVFHHVLGGGEYHPNELGVQVLVRKDEHRVIPW
jgi:hypothetical protein